jgi:hypothetical protein
MKTVPTRPGLPYCNSTFTADCLIKIQTATFLRRIQNLAFRYILQSTLCQGNSKKCKAVFLKCSDAHFCIVCLITDFDSFLSILHYLKFSHI